MTLGGSLLLGLVVAVLASTVVLLCANVMGGRRPADGVLIVPWQERRQERRGCWAWLLIGVIFVTLWLTWLLADVIWRT